MEIDDTASFCFNFYYKGIVFGGFFKRLSLAIQCNLNLTGRALDQL